MFSNGERKISANRSRLSAKPSLHPKTKRNKNRIKYWRLLDSCFHQPRVNLFPCLLVSLAQSYASHSFSIPFSFPTHRHLQSFPFPPTEETPRQATEFRPSLFPLTCKQLTIIVPSLSCVERRSPIALRRIVIPERRPILRKSLGKS